MNIEPFDKDTAVTEQVKRWGPLFPGAAVVRLVECTDGEMVAYTDYAALLAERDRLKGVISNIKRIAESTQSSEHAARSAIIRHCESAVAALLEPTT